MQFGTDILNANNEDLSTEKLEDLTFENMLKVSYSILKHLCTKRNMKDFLSFLIFTSPIFFELYYVY